MNRKRELRHFDNVEAFCMFGMPFGIKFFSREKRGFLSMVSKIKLKSIKPQNGLHSDEIGRITEEKVV